MNREIPEAEVDWPAVSFFGDPYFPADAPDAAMRQDRAGCRFSREN
jgi:hypothetical protein